MINKMFRGSITSGAAKLVRAGAGLAMLLPMLSAAPIANVSAGGVQPALMAAAAQHPDAKVAVIVQKSTKDGSVEQSIARLGGKVTKDLHIINAVGAEMSASAAEQLAHASGVKWVSLDSAITYQGGTPPPPPAAPPSFTTWATTVSANNMSSVSGTFNAMPIMQGKYIWLNSALRVNVPQTAPVTVTFDNISVSLNVSGAVFNMQLPPSSITYSPSATTATTSYDSVNGRWVTVAPSRLANSNTFLTGMAEQVPTNLPGNIGPLTVTGRFTSDTPGVTVNSWAWGAAIYNSFDSSYANTGVKPVDDGSASQYHNSDKAGTPENYKTSLIAGGTGNGGNNYVGAYAGATSATPSLTFFNANNAVDAPKGADGTYAYAGNGAASFTNFSCESRDNTRITKVEAALQTYVPVSLSGSDAINLSTQVSGATISSVSVDKSRFNPFVGASHAGLLYVDITGSRNWLWSDFDNALTLTVNQSNFGTGQSVYYDAIGLRVTTAQGDDESGGMPPTSQNKDLIDPYKLGNVFNSVVQAPQVWDEYPNYYQGQGLTVAVLDSGVVANKDLGSRLIDGVNFNGSYADSADTYGHGTFVAGLIAGDGSQSGGKYMGIAPNTNILNVRVSDDTGAANESDVVNAMQWVLDNKAKYNIKVVNMSLNSSVASSYLTSAMDAAAEVLWFNGVVVVVSAGNNGTNTLYPPANDPFVITVGATDDRGTASISDDVRAAYSSYGVSEAGTVKPELVAPGTHIIGYLPKNGQLTISMNHTANQVDPNYFRMSGTSMAAPIVSGAAALLLQSNPNLNPDRVKYRLMSTAQNGSTWPGYNAATTGAGLLNIYAAVHSTSTASDNTNIRASQLLQTGTDPINWGSVNWNSVNWNSVNWNSVNWNSVNWNSVNWNSDYWAAP